VRAPPPLRPGRRPVVARRRRRDGVRAVSAAHDSTRRPGPRLEGGRHAAVSTSRRLRHLEHGAIAPRPMPCSLVAAMLRSMVAPSRRVADTLTSPRWLILALEGSGRRAPHAWRGGRPDRAPLLLPLGVPAGSPPCWTWCATTQPIVEPGARLVFASHYIERIGDRVTDITEEHRLLRLRRDRGSQPLGPRSEDGRITTMPSGPVMGPIRHRRSEASSLHRGV